MDMVLFKLFNHDDLNHCLLCWEKSSDIRFSHVEPKAVLVYFEKIYPGGIDGFLLTYSSGHPKYVPTAKSVRWKMLCRKCEVLISPWENCFVKAFCNETNDPSQQSKQIIRIHGEQQEQQVPYDKWLRSFLISIVWRLLIHRFATDSSNEYEALSGSLRELLHSCRCACGQSRGIPCFDFDFQPKVAFIIAPTNCSKINNYSALLLPYGTMSAFAPTSVSRGYTYVKNAQYSQTTAFSGNLYLYLAFQINE